MTLHDSEQTSSQATTRQSDLTDAVQRSKLAWQRLGMRFRSITPSAVARFLMLMAAFGAIVWAIVSTWPALLPFAVGGVIAYILLPVVNWLDRFMPRLLAAFLTMLVVFVSIVGLIVFTIPIIAQQTVQLYQSLPTQESIRALVAPLATRDLSPLPPAIQALLRDQVTEAVTIVRGRVDAYVNSLPNLVLFTIQAVISTVSIVLGLLVIPTWLLALLKDHKLGVRAIDRNLPPWMRGDFWAIVRIVDRVVRSFLRGQFVLGLATGLALYGGLILLQRIGFEGARYPVILSIFVALMGMIPQVGNVLGLLAIAIAGLTHSWQSALAMIAVYLGVQYLLGLLLVPNLERRVVDIHPVVQVLVLVAISQFGLFWIILSTPLIAIVRDLFLYVYGRLGDPPRPAGVLPNTANPEPNVSTVFNGPYAPGPRVPLADRRRRLVR